MTTRNIVSVGFIVSLFGFLFAYHAWSASGMARAHQKAANVATVATATVRPTSWVNYVDVVGSLKAIQGEDVTAPVAGNITRIEFQSGDYLTRGQLIVQVDNSNQMSQLSADRARQALTSANFRRLRTLYARHAASQADLDNATEAFRSSRAQVENDEATLHKLAVSAPFSGYAGIRRVSLGEYVSPGTAIVSLQQLNPLHLLFNLPQADFDKIHYGQPVAFTVDAYPKFVFHGQITAIDSAVNVASRNIELQATIDNSKHLLRPGMFGSVRLTIDAPYAVLTIPLTALEYNTFGTYVYVVSPFHQGGAKTFTVWKKLIHTADERDGMAVVTSGLKRGQTVVTAGQMKLYDGALVSVNNDVAF